MTYSNFLFFVFLLFGLFPSALLANEIEEIISVGSYIESTEANASPVDVISNEEFKQLRVSTVAEISKYLSVASGSHFQTNALDGGRPRNGCHHSQGSRSCFYTCSD